MKHLFLSVYMTNNDDNYWCWKTTTIDGVKRWYCLVLLYLTTTLMFILMLLLHDDDFFDVKFWWYILDDDFFSWDVNVFLVLTTTLWCKVWRMFWSENETMADDLLLLLNGCWKNGCLFWFHHCFWLGSDRFCQIKF